MLGKYLGIKGEILSSSERLDYMQTLLSLLKTYKFNYYTSPSIQFHDNENPQSVQHLYLGK